MRFFTIDTIINYLLIQSARVWEFTKPDKKEDKKDFQQARDGGLDLQQRTHGNGIFHAILIANKSVISKEDRFNIRSDCSVANNFKSWELCQAKSELSHVIRGRFPTRQADKRYSQEGTIESSLVVQPSKGKSFHSSTIMFHSCFFSLKHR